MSPQETGPQVEVEIEIEDKTIFLGKDKKQKKLVWTVN